MKQRGKVKGIWTLKTIDLKTGKILQQETVENMIVNTGLTRIRDLVFGQGGADIVAIAVGTDNTGALAADTELGTEVIRSISATYSEPDAYTGRLEYTFSFGGSYSIVEAGLFDSETASGSTMLNRATFAAKSVSAVIGLIATVDVIFADA
jgi:hypothetical protein